MTIAHYKEPMQYINVSNIKKLAKAKGRRVSKAYLLQLDIWIEQKVESSCRLHNGGKATLTADLLGFSKMNKKLYELHELYKKHNYDGPAFVGTWCGEVDNIQPCTCGCQFRSYGKENGTMGYFNFDETNHMYAAHLLMTLPKTMAKDFEQFLTQVQPKLVEKAKLTSKRSVTIFQNKAIREQRKRDGFNDKPS
jgi:hypothetical protein